MPTRSAFPSIPWRTQAVLAVLLLVSVGPFLDRAINVDEPVFLWIAQHIVHDPIDFYGFDVNWVGTPQAVHEFMMNPPLSSYYLALVGSLAGWGEAVLHAGFVPVALAALLGTHALAARFSSRPLVAALAVLWTPAFGVASTTIMSDTLAVAFWVWALVLWDRGLRQSRPGSLVAAALLAGLASLTEYFSIALLPLLALHALVTTRRAGAWLGALAIPLAMFVTYERVTAAWYGHSLVFGAAAYASAYRISDLGVQAQRLGLGLAFTGGCAASLLFLAPSLLSRRALLVWALAAVLASGLFALLPLSDVVSLGSGWIAAQFLFWCVVGLGVLALAVDDFRRTRAGEAVTLLAWVLGTFVFASFVNWTINARSVLPMLPAVGILIARRLDRRTEAGQPPLNVAVAGGLMLAAVFSVAISWSDARLATATRTAARSLVEEFGTRGTRVWFMGHWGFQHYAQSLGAQSLDRCGSSVARGDWILRPLNNSYLFPLPKGVVATRVRREFPLPRWVSTQNLSAGSGFYAASFGPLPFALGGAEAEAYWAFHSQRDFELDCPGGELPQ